MSEPSTNGHLSEEEDLYYRSLVNTESSELSEGSEDSEDAVTRRIFIVGAPGETACLGENRSEDSGNSDDSEDSVLTSPFQEEEELEAAVARAILETLPGGASQRYRSLFAFARRIKSMPEFSDRNPVSLEELVQRWYEAALAVIGEYDRRDLLVEFADGWDLVKFAAGAGPMDLLWNRAFGFVPVEIRNTDDEAYRQLIELCRLLQQRKPKEPFFLACRTVGMLAGISHVSAAKWLRLLVRQGVLERVSIGSLESRHANEYKYLGVKHGD